MFSKEIEISGKTYKVRYDYNSIADIDDVAKTTLGTLLSAERMGFGTLRLLFWAGIKWAEKGITVAQAGDVLGQYIKEGNTLADISEICIEMLEKSGLLVTPKDDDEEGKK